jgi:hypothetical protein
MTTTPRVPTVDTLVIDLDHTVFHRTSTWAEAVRRATRALPRAGADRDQRRDAWKASHRPHDTMEFARTLDELRDGPLRPIGARGLGDSVRRYGRAWRDAPLICPAAVCPSSSARVVPCWPEGSARLAALTHWDTGADAALTARSPAPRTANLDSVDQITTAARFVPFTGRTRR